MSIHELEVESNSGGIIMMLEIVYECEDTEYGSIDGGRLTYRVPGQINLEEVNVLAVVGYDRDGAEVYEYDHRQLSKERLEQLDEVAWNIVEYDICDGGRIYEELWERA
jgi:hypothetical protein